MSIQLGVISPGRENSIAEKRLFFVLEIFFSSQCSYPSHVTLNNNLKYGVVKMPLTHCCNCIRPTFAKIDSKLCNCELNEHFSAYHIYPIR